VRFFSHVGITVSSVDRGIAFYTDVLGFRVLFQSDHDGWRAPNWPQSLEGDPQ
jgi:catechol 2,3-dioxygenase-like lactoylglutathione lyase family enzyme